jgi:hypothetical protein
MAVSVQVVGREQLLEKIRSRLKRFMKDGQELNVGILGGSTYVDGPLAGELVAPVLAYHEFGTKRIPARAPLRSTLEKKKHDWVGLLAALLQAYAGRADRAVVENALTALGEKAAKDIQRAFEEGLPPPLKAATVKRKEKMGYPAHAQKAVMLTGSTQQAISYEITRAGE